MKQPNMEEMYEEIKNDIMEIPILEEEVGCEEEPEVVTDTIEISDIDEEPIIDQETQSQG